MATELVELPPELDAACRDGDADAALAELDSFRAAHPAWTRQDALAQIALHALNHGQIAVHRACLARGFIIDPAAKELNQAFAFGAIACDDLEILQLHLEQGQLPMDIGSAATGDMLNAAATANAVEVATWLLDAQGVDVDSQKTPYGQPIPVVVAASGPDDSDDTRFLQLLLDHGVTVQGTGAICEAAKAGHTRAVDCLLAAGADREEAVTHGMADERLDCGTPLWLAAGQGADDTVDALIQRGADLHYRDPRYHLTPLLIARVRGHEECADLIELALMEEEKQKQKQ